MSDIPDNPLINKKKIKQYCSVVNKNNDILFKNGSKRKYHETCIINCIKTIEKVKFRYHYIFEILLPFPRFHFNIIDCVCIKKQFIKQSILIFSLLYFHAKTAEPILIFWYKDRCDAIYA